MSAQLMVEHVQTPEPDVQRKILKAKMQQLQAQGYESLLNARLNEVQARITASEREKTELLKAATQQVENGRQLYACAAECQKLLVALSDPPAEHRAEEETVRPALVD